MLTREISVVRLTDKTIKTIDPPDEGYALNWDDELKGLGLRTTAAGVKSFILNYRNSDGVQRRITIGRASILTATAARLKAVKLLRTIADGEDPLRARKARQEAQIVSSSEVRKLSFESI